MCQLLCHVHRSSAVVGLASAISCRAPVIVCHALVLYIGGMCRCHVSASYIGVMHRLSLVVHWLFAIGCLPSSAISHWLSAVVCWRSCVVRRWLLAVRIPLSVIRRWSSVVHRWSSIICHWPSILHHPLVIIGHPLLVAGCRLSLVVIPHRRRWLSAQGPAIHGQGGVKAFPSVRPPEKKKKSSERDAHHSGWSQYPRLQPRVLHTC